MIVGLVRTFEGRSVDLFDPKSSDISIADLAHHLAGEPRWGNAARRTISVAEHSVWVAKYVKKMVPGNERLLALALLHDAHEYLLKDIPTPFKRMLGPEYKKVASRLDSAIFEHFGLEHPSEMEAAVVHMADQYSAYWESRVLCPKGQPAGEEPPFDIGQNYGLMVAPSQPGKQWRDWLELVLRAPRI